MDSFFSTFISTFSYCDFLYYGGWKKILNTVASVLKFTGHPLPANPALSGITLQREVVFPPIPITPWPLELRLKLDPNLSHT